VSIKDIQAGWEEKRSGGDLYCPSVKRVRKGVLKPKGFVARVKGKSEGIRVMGSAEFRMR